MCVFHTSLQRLEVAILSSGHFFFLQQNKTKQKHQTFKERGKPSTVRGTKSPETILEETWA